MRIRQRPRSPTLPAHRESGVRLQRIGRAAQVELKVVTIDAGAATPQRAHAYTHLVLAGTGAIVTADYRQLIGPDDVVAKAPDESHAIAAGPDAARRFVCLDGPDSEGDRAFQE
jgi:quercetin dioxygenase-like cupin family protein